MCSAFACLAFVSQMCFSGRGSERQQLPAIRDQTTGKALEGKRPTDDLAQAAVIGLDAAWDVLLPHKVGAEEHERVRRAGDVALAASLARRDASPRRRRRGCGAGREQWQRLVSGERWRAKGRGRRRRCRVGYGGDIGGKGEGRRDRRRGVAIRARLCERYLG